MNDNTENADFEYEVVRSKRKTVGLEVKRDGKVYIRVPMRMSERDIKQAVDKNRDWIIKTLKKQRIRFENTPIFDENDIVFLRQKAKDILPQKVEYYSNIMGLYPTSLKITSAKTRFGSCSGKNGICFSLYLMQYPEKAVDYVVVHELAHIKHHNHSSAFYALIEKYLPDYKERKKLLK